MITEETVKQTRFYKGVPSSDDDSKFFMIRKVENVKRVKLVDCSDGEESSFILGDDICSQFAPVEVRFKAFSENKMPAPSRTKSPAGSGHYRKPKTVRGGKPPSSQFKGVRQDKRGYADGRKRWQSNYYDPKTQKVEHLGSFDNEFLAAAAYEERAGNKARAQELCNLAEQANNNPNRPGTKKKIWACKRCGLEYRTDPTSNGCPGCNSNDFRITE